MLGKLNAVPPEYATASGLPLSFTVKIIESVPGVWPGVAMMVVLISRSGYCTITTRYDRAAITDPELFARCLLSGFDEVLALGGDGRAAPVSFTIDTAGSTPVSPNGSVAQ